MPNHITQISLTNFKGHENTVVPLSPFTVLVGQNGTGKTSVLEAIDFVRESLRSAPVAVSLHPGFRRSSREPTSPPVTIRVSIEEQSIVTLTVPSAVSEARFSISGAGNLAAQLAERSVFARIDPSHAAAPSFSGVESPRIEMNGLGVPTALKELRSTDPSRFESFSAAVRNVIPLVEDFTFVRRKRTELRPRSIRVENQLFEVQDSVDVIDDELQLRFIGTEFLSLASASEGTRIVIGLLALLYTQRSTPTVLLIDDLDRGLHIQAQEDLVTALRGVQKQNPELQIIATSHSPYLVDLFAPSEVVILRRPRLQAPIEASRLSDHPDKVLRGFKTGESLVATGKDWFG